MFISVSHAERLRDEVRQQPLEQGEIRRIKGLGNLYMALVTTEVDSTKYKEMYSLFIDDVEYIFYGQTKPQKEGAVA